MLFSKLFNPFNLFHYQLLVAAIKQAAAIASISAHFHRSCLFLTVVILLLTGTSVLVPVSGSLPFSWTSLMGIRMYVTQALSLTVRDTALRRPKAITLP